MVDFKNFQNLYEVRKTVRFELFPLKKSNRFELSIENVLLNVDFLMKLLFDFENLPSTKNLSQGSLSHFISTYVSDRFGTSVEVIKKHICKVIYEQVNQTMKPSEVNEYFVDKLTAITKKEFNYFTGNASRREYKPGVNYFVPKVSYVRVSIKILAQLINDVSDNADEIYTNIVSYNPNRDGFFDLGTLNPYTVNRWKKETILHKCAIVSKDLQDLKSAINQKTIKLRDDMLRCEDLQNLPDKDNRDPRQKSLAYLMHLLSEIENHEDKGLIIVNKYGILDDEKESIQKYQKLRDLKKEIYILNKEYEKKISEINGYKMQLVDNFGVEQFSMLVKGNKDGFYFLVQKKIWSDCPVKSFQERLKQLPGGHDNGVYIDSMTRGGFKKLFLLPSSDVGFTDGTNVQDYNKEVLQLYNDLESIKKQIAEKFSFYKREFVTDMNSLSKELKEKRCEFDKFLTEKQVKVDYSLTLKKKNLKIFKKEFLSYLYQFVSEELEITKIEEKLLEKLKEFLSLIRDKKYKIGKEDHGLDFINSDFLEETGDLQNFERLFTQMGYGAKIVSLNVDGLIDLAMADDTLEIYQVFCKDFPHDERFPTERKYLATQKISGCTKNANTLYWELVFESLISGKYWQDYKHIIGADYKIRGRNKESNMSYETFRSKNKNKLRHMDHKDDIESFMNRFKRQRLYGDFLIGLNATSWTTLEGLNEKIKTVLKTKYGQGTPFRILPLDHGEGSFLTYGIYESKIGEPMELREGNAGDWDDAELLHPHQNIPEKKQKLLSHNVTRYDDILAKYVTKYHLMIQDEKRERQVQAGIKKRVNILVGKLKKEISDGRGSEIPRIIQARFDLSPNGKEKDGKKNTYKEKQGLGYILDREFDFCYTKYKYKQTHPDQINIKDCIDTYIQELQHLCKDTKDCSHLAELMKGTFGKRGSDEELLQDTPLYGYKKYFKSTLSQINNLKRGYISVLVGYIAELLISGKINMIVIEDNLLQYGSRHNESFPKHMGTHNHPIFIDALMKKLCCVINKNTKEITQYAYPLTDKQRFGVQQNGCIFVVPEKETSKTCPRRNCGKTLDRKKEGNDILKHEPKVTNCDFYINKNEYKTEEVDGIVFHDGDDLATYNIAKRGLEYLQSL